MEKELFKSKCDEIINSTMTLSFPLLSSEKKKLQIIELSKKSIEEKYLLLSSEYGLRSSLPDSIWSLSLADSKEKFISLPPPARLNGFYLQELMHEYAYNISVYLLEQVFGQEEV